VEEIGKDTRSVSSLWLPGDLWVVGMDPVLEYISLCCCTHILFLFRSRHALLNSFSLSYSKRQNTTRAGCVFSQLIFKPPKLQSARNGIDIKETICVCSYCVERWCSLYFLRSIYLSGEESQSTRSLSMHPSSSPPPPSYTFSSDLAGGCRAKSISAGGEAEPSRHGN